MTRDASIGVIVRALPYPAQINDWDTSTETEAIRFTWRGVRYRFSLDSMMVEECQDGMLAGSDKAILVEALIKRAWIDLLVPVTAP